MTENTQAWGIKEQRCVHVNDITEDYDVRLEMLETFKSLSIGTRLMKKSTELSSSCIAAK